MKEIRLKVKKIPDLGLEAECITPDVFAGKNSEEIRNLKAWSGNQEKTLGEYFEIEGDAGGKEETKIIIEGDASKIKRIGQEMTSGEIVVSGSCGMHLGSRIKGGKIRVMGSCGSYMGMEIAGGEIEVRGNVGDYCCSSYVGRAQGMTGGEVTIKGDCGVGLGKNMLGGKIVVDGNSSYFAGSGMKGGMIEIKKDCLGRPGAQMLKGEIRIHGKTEALPSFRLEGAEGDFQVYIGDLADSGEGRVYIKK